MQSTGPSASESGRIFWLILRNSKIIGEAPEKIRETKQLGPRQICIMPRDKGTLPLVAQTHSNKVSGIEQQNMVLLGRFMPSVPSSFALYSQESLHKKHSCVHTHKQREGGREGVAGKLKRKRETQYRHKPCCCPNKAG
ncbi:hypothetical protein TRVL_07851 [Trypanosoma vivax]|uniref:Uncharacterized protein n=1 Tax=Trypanosoma vivax (strain Y486) TaxID=1055687 RepID=G0TYD5_TRYVY|nr:hypothetical protein TRVL_07851 [Trypanosoma vivax]CCC48982.1 hypothetical protein, unlikely [Trypanosoma vivax Y486]